MVKNSSAILLYFSHSTCLGWEKERDKIIAKCHKDTYNYCDEGHRKKVGDCVKGMADSLMVSDSMLASVRICLTCLGVQLKYGATAMAYCPILDEKVENWEKSGDKEHALKLFTEYCATKGKKC